MQWLELKVPPPLVGLATDALMWALPGPTLSLPEGLRWSLAFGLGLSGLAIDLAGVLSFRRARTTINPLRPQRSAALVDTGLFAHTRNPMYLGMLVVLLGWLAFLAAPVALLGPLLFVAYITRFQITPEERVLTGLFGEAFRVYCRRVRRWI
jgi:protein-S-isoprenylcysteine O-methyltransferase Ste14